jgi:hypothetical protein
MKKQIVSSSIVLVCCATIHVHAQNLFVNNWGSGTVAEYGSDGSLINGSFVSTFAGPFGIMFDSSGNLYMSTAESNGSADIAKYSPSGVLLEPNILFGNGGGLPGNQFPGMAFDSMGNLWVTGASYLYEINPAGMAVQGIYVGNSFVRHIAIAPNGNIFVSREEGGSPGAVLEYSSTGSLINATFADSSSGLLNPGAIAFDSGGNLWVTDQYRNMLDEYDSSGTQLKTISVAALNGPEGLAIDGNGNFWVGNLNNGGSIVELNPDGNVLRIINNVLEPNDLAFPPVPVPEPPVLGVLALVSATVVARSRRKKCNRPEIQSGR